MKIVVVTTFYSVGMGYTENCLPKALAALGHDVHVVTSNYNVYGASADYDRTYKDFLGDADQGVGRLSVDGYTVHRLPSRLVSGYVRFIGLPKLLRALRPDIVHSTEIASLQTFQLAALRALPGHAFALFAETHQHLSVVRPELRQPSGALLQKTIYRLTRTLPTSLASRAVEACYAIAPDCVDVAHRFYGVPRHKLKLQSLGTDAELFRPAASEVERAQRTAARRALGYGDGAIVCVYTGRFSEDKNPLLLAQAVERLTATDPRYHGVFVGEGVQRAAIASSRNTTIRSFMRHAELADLYRIADIAVWPRQESMSMLDAAASALPLVVAHTIGESDRVNGNGLTYRENDAGDLARVLATLASPDERRRLGARGREKMLAQFSWRAIAASLESDYRAALGRNASRVA